MKHPDLDVIDFHGRVAVRSLMFRGVIECRRPPHDIVPSFGHYVREYSSAKKPLFPRIDRQRLRCRYEPYSHFEDVFNACHSQLS